MKTYPPLNTSAFASGLIARLLQAGLPVWLAGGWAEECRGLSGPRPHQDIDLLYRAAGFAGLDAFIACQADFQAVAAKRFPHKRAVECQGVLVEFVLVQIGPAGCYTSFFAGRTRLDWPADAFDCPASFDGRSLPVASPAALRAYRAHYPEIQSASQQYHKNNPI